MQIKDTTIGRDHTSIGKSMETTINGLTNAGMGDSQSNCHNKGTHTDILGLLSKRDRGLLHRKTQCGIKKSRQTHTNQ